MAIPKGPVDGGQGGKLGHSNMNHWDYAEAVKAAARKWRRLKAKREISEGLNEHRENQTVPKPRSRQ